MVDIYADKKPYKITEPERRGFMKDFGSITNPETNETMKIVPKGMGWKPYVLVMAISATVCGMIRHYYYKGAYDYMEADLNALHDLDLLK